MRNQETLKFGVQVLFSSIVLIFCIYKLAIASDNQSSNALYWGGMTSVLAWWMPSPGGQRGSAPSIQTGTVNIDQVSDAAMNSSSIETAFNSKN